MVWFKVDDRFHGSEPVKRIPREHRAAAIGLWTLAGTWSSQFLKDGFVPGHMLEDFGGSPELARQLVAAGLWRVRRDGFVFVDWGKWQPTRDHVESKRRATAERVAAHRARKAADKGESNASVTRYDDVSNAPVRVSRPDPTRPDPTKSGERASRATRIPDLFIVTPEMREWAAGEVPGLDVDASTRRFVDYWRAESGAKASKKDWVATWRNWLRRDHERVRPVGAARMSDEEIEMDWARSR